MLKRIRDFWSDTAGASTVEFVMVAPLFLGAVFATFEAGWLMTKSMMLERAVDVSVRDIRFGNTKPITQSLVKDRICDNIIMVRDCDATLILEMTEVDPALAGADIASLSACQDASVFVAPSDATFVFVRACVPIKPIFPLLGLALHLPRDAEDDMVIIAYSSFVTEPAILPIPPSTGS